MLRARPFATTPVAHTLRMSESSCIVSVRWFSARVRLWASPEYATLITEISTEISTEKIVTPFA